MNAYSTHWDLSSNVLHLNHGSYGVCPRVIVEHQRKIQQQIEQDPNFFFITEAEDRIMLAKEELARFLVCDPVDLVWVKNATTGVNVILRSLSFRAGDQVLITAHIYNACRNVIDYIVREKGVELVVAPISFPLESGEQIKAAILERVSQRTRLVMLDHITSASALIFPLKQILQELNQRGIDSLIDGAHSPGQIDLNLSELNATYYIGNCHKWLFSPRGTAFLHVQRNRQGSIQPAVISHGSNAVSDSHSDFQLRFKWGGTEDLSAMLSVPAALTFPALAGFSEWAELIRQNHQLAVVARSNICQILEVAEPCPADLLGAMATIPLPADIVAAIPRLPIKIEALPQWNFRRQLLAEPRFRLWQYLYCEHGIDAMFSDLPGDSRLFLRISAQLYNDLEEYQKLAQTLASLAGR